MSFDSHLVTAISSFRMSPRQPSCPLARASGCLVQPGSRATRPTGGLSPSASCCYLCLCPRCRLTAQALPPRVPQPRLPAGAQPHAARGLSAWAAAPRLPKTWQSRVHQAPPYHPAQRVTCAARRRFAGRLRPVRAPEGGEISSPLHFQSIAHPGACGKTRVMPHNRWPGPETYGKRGRAMRVLLPACGPARGVESLAGPAVRPVAGKPAPAACTRAASGPSCRLRRSELMTWNS